MKNDVYVSSTEALRLVRCITGTPDLDINGCTPFSSYHFKDKFNADTELQLRIEKMSWKILSDRKYSKDLILTGGIYDFLPFTAVQFRVHFDVQDEFLLGQNTMRKFGSDQADRIAFYIMNLCESFDGVSQIFLDIRKFNKKSIEALLTFAVEDPLEVCRTARLLAYRHLRDRSWLARSTRDAINVHMQVIKDGFERTEEYGVRILNYEIIEPDMVGAEDRQELQASGMIGFQKSILSHAGDSFHSWVKKNDMFNSEKPGTIDIYRASMKYLNQASALQKIKKNRISEGSGQILDMSGA